MTVRCSWCGTDPLYVEYHDREWGVPTLDDASLFEMLVLEGAQAGLSWLTILRKREGYRELFDDFDPNRIARYPDRKLDKLLLNPKIIRNRLKVYGTRQNARAFLAVQDEVGSFSEYIWGFVDHRPTQNKWRNMKEVPATTPTSDSLSKDLKKRGFTFVGSTIMYAHMQSTGMVNDHTIDCFRHRECRRMASTVPGRS
ncbi:MAG: DNA-3-methyladenine glycosylase I [Pseudomonadales bacterium]|nr:DNA-3-methyladenine glycosylase I [Pseudomonadales bacterium]